MKAVKSEPKHISGLVNTIMAVLRMRAQDAAEVRVAGQTTEPEVDHDPA